MQRNTVSVISKSKKSLVESFTCKYCSKSFKKESTLAVHLCEQKRRSKMSKEPHVKVGFLVYLDFYRVTMPQQKKHKDYIEFAQSKYFMEFIKFGRHVLELQLTSDLQKEFIGYVINESIKLRDWTKGETFDRFLKKYLSYELPLRAIERTILTAEEWGLKENEHWTTFFNKVSSFNAVHLICTGRISPWVILGTSTGNQLLKRLNNEQLGLVGQFLDIPFWEKKVTEPDDNLKIIDEYFHD
jgi:hypothetical protein